MQNIFPNLSIWDYRQNYFIYQNQNGCDAHFGNAKFICIRKQYIFKPRMYLQQQQKHNLNNCARGLKKGTHFYPNVKLITDTACLCCMQQLRSFLKDKWSRESLCARHDVKIKRYLRGCVVGKHFQRFKYEYTINLQHARTKDILALRYIRFVLHTLKWCKI